MMPVKSTSKPISNCTLDTPDDVLKSLTNYSRKATLPLFVCPKYEAYTNLTNYPKYNYSASVDISHASSVSTTDSFYSISSLTSQASLATIEGDSDLDDITLASETLNTSSLAYHSLSSNQDHHNSDTTSISTTCGDSSFDSCNCQCLPKPTDRIEHSIEVLLHFPEERLNDQKVRVSENLSILSLKLETLEKVKTLEGVEESGKEAKRRSRSQHRNSKNQLKSLRSSSTHTHSTNSTRSLDEIHELNFGFFCQSLSTFLDEDVSLIEFFRDRIFDKNLDFCLDCFRKTVIELDFRYKARSRDIFIMSSSGGSSTLPTSSSTRKKKKRSKLLDAVNSGNAEKIVKILANVDPNFIDDSTGETPLSLAASNPTLQNTSIHRVIVALVNGGAILDFRNRDGRTPLHVAVLKSNYVALKTLLDLGGSPNYRDSNGLTPLFYSIIHKANPKVTQLLLHEYSVHGVADQQGWQEAHHACKLGLASHLEQLLFYGIDMNAKISGSGNTPLHVAAINEQAECARLLLLRGCDPSVVNNSHQNAYQVAVIAGNHNLADLIQKHKPEQVVPYRDKPKYNPGRKPPAGFDNLGHPPKSQSGNVICPPSPSTKQRLFPGNENGLSNGSKISTSMGMNGRNDSKTSGYATLPVRGKKSSLPPLIKQDSSSSSSSESPPITSYQEKTVSLHRGNRGFGFVLRGAKAPASKSLHSDKGLQPISLQYLDEIEDNGVAQMAGLEKGDFLLNVNGVDVSHAPHEQVVALIRQSGDKVTMTVAKPIYLQLEPEEAEREREAKEKRRAEKRATKETLDVNLDMTNDQNLPLPPPPSSTSIPSFSSVNESLYGDGSGRSRSRVPPPAPPKRDPSTTLTTGRSRTQSLASTDDGIEPPPPPPPVTNGSMTGQMNGVKSADPLSRINRRDSYDSEGRSDKSSSPSNSIESVIPNPNQKNHLQQNGVASMNGASKTASIRSQRGVRRLSGVELEEFLSRQDSAKDSPNKKDVKTSQTLKRKKEKKEETLTKTFHSTGDIHQEILIMQQQESVKTVIDTSSLNRSKKSASQELLEEHLKKNVETVTLKNGKIVNDCRAPPPSHPPPPVPDESSLPRPPSSLLKSQESLDKKNDSEYANHAQIKMTPESGRNRASAQFSLSSFKAPAPLPPPNTVQPPEKKEPPMVPPKQGILKAAKQPKQSGAQPSLYTRQPTMDLMEERKKDSNKLFVAEQDGSTSEEETGIVQPLQDLKTFKAPQMTQSLHEAVNGLNNNTSGKGGSSQEVGKVAPTQGVGKDVDAVNKVKASIREFERRSSLTDGVAVTTSVACTQDMPSTSSNKGSMNGSSTGGTSLVTIAKKGEDAYSATSTAPTASANIRMSRSLYEVESCLGDNSTPTSTDQSQYAQYQHDLANNVNNQLSKVQTLNRRNSAVVSEKIATLIAQTHPHGHPSPGGHTQTLPSSMKQHGMVSRSLEKRVSIADPPEQPSPSSSSSGTSAKAAPTTAKTWSEISSAIKAVKGTPSQVVSSQSNRPISAPTAKQLSRHGSGDSGIIELVPPPPEFAAPPPGSQQPKMQAHLRTDPATGQTHIIYKPQVKPPAPAVPGDVNRSTPPQELLLDSNSAAVRLGVTAHGQTVYRMVSSQQAQMLHSKHQQQQQAITQQQFATLSRAYAGAGGQGRGHQASHNQVATNCSQQAVGSRSPQMQRSQFAVSSGQSSQQQQQQYLASQGYQQFATLSRAGQKALASGQMASSAYNDFTRLTLQNRLMRQNDTVAPQQHSQQQWTQLTPQQMQQLTPQQKQALFHRLQAQQQYIHMHHGHDGGMTNGSMSQSFTLPHSHSVISSHVPGKGHAPPAPTAVVAKRPVSFPRKPIAEWTKDDVCDWLTSIGMSDHRKSFEHMNGSKLLRLDNNDLLGFGLKSSQHRVYVLEKIKQYVAYQQQHPPTSGQS